MENSKLEDLVQAWSEIYMGEVLEFAKPKDVSNEEVFGDVYHSLIHSSVAETLVRLEHSNAQVRINLKIIKTNLCRMPSYLLN